MAETIIICYWALCSGLVPILPARPYFLYLGLGFRSVICMLHNDILWQYVTGELAWCLIKVLIKRKLMANEIVHHKNVIKLLARGFHDENIQL